MNRGIFLFNISPGLPDRKSRALTSPINIIKINKSSSILEFIPSFCMLCFSDRVFTCFVRGNHVSMILSKKMFSGQVYHRFDHLPFADPLNTLPHLFLSLFMILLLTTFNVKIIVFGMTLFACGGLVRTRTEMDPRSPRLRTRAFGGSPYHKTIDMTFAEF